MTSLTSDGYAINHSCNPYGGNLIYCDSRFLCGPGTRNIIQRWRSSSSANARAGHRGPGRLCHRLVCGLVPHTGLCPSASPGPSIYAPSPIRYTRQQKPPIIRGRRTPPSRGHERGPRERRSRAAPTKGATQQSSAREAKSRRAIVVGYCPSCSIDLVH